MAYKLLQLELSEPLPTIALDMHEDGIGVVARWRGRLVGFRMAAFSPGACVTSGELEKIADACFAQRVLTTSILGELAKLVPNFSPPSLPSLSIVICTKDRAPRLARLLRSVVAVRPRSPFAAIEVIVVDNASVDDATRQAAAGFDDVAYVFERKAGLNFARNTGLRAARGDLVAYLDDDVVVDVGWLDGLADAWRSCPDLGGVTGLVLPYRLDTPAQIRFEERGGFGRGFARREFRTDSFAQPLFPVGSGILGAGCNMAFDRQLLLDMSGFDEALDTGAPLPGGGDLDIFYRVPRAGRTMVYEPGYAVYHEHRETMAQLRRQYWSWGLGFAAFVAKSRRSDPELRGRQRRMIGWWFGDQARQLAVAACRGDGAGVRFVVAELFGGIQGLAGEYGRSSARSEAIRRATA